MAKVEISPEARTMLRNFGKMVTRPRLPDKKRDNIAAKFRKVKRLGSDETVKPLSQMGHKVRVTTPVEESISFAARKLDPPKQIRTHRRRS